MPFLGARHSGHLFPLTLVGYYLPDLVSYYMIPDGVEFSGNQERKKKTQSC